LKLKLPTTVAAIAANALLRELAASPKPGLVDRLSSGSHRDMDFFTFIDSITAITPYIAECAGAGLDLAHNAAALFTKLRSIGLRGETAMLQATGGVNTHKGAIFALGIIAAAYASSHTDSDMNEAGLRQSILRLCSALAQTELPHQATKGEILSTVHGIKGARQQAVEGFPAVFEVGLPLYRQAKERLSPNDAAVQTLLGIMAVVDDTNIVSRAGMEALHWVKNEANRALKSGGMFTASGRKAIDLLCVGFRDRNISPGGGADMLSATIFTDNLVSC
jgi:triphosphoribosyl-dephospho-CoA synthase CitG